MKNILACVLTAGTLFANQTYEIIEQDFISEIESQKDTVQLRIEDYKKESTSKINNFTGTVLTQSIENKTKYIDPTYTVKEDIPKYDKTGKKVGYLYKKGYKFNPLEMINIIPPDMIIFNACKENEGKFVTSLIEDYESRNKDYMLVNSGCKNEDVKKSSFAKKVYFLTDEMVKKFKLEHTVSILSVNKEMKRLVVKEISLSEETIIKN